MSGINPAFIAFVKGLSRNLAFLYRSLVFESLFPSERRPSLFFSFFSLFLRISGPSNHSPFCLSYSPKKSVGKDRKKIWQREIDMAIDLFASHIRQTNQSKKTEKRHEKEIKTWLFAFLPLIFAKQIRQKKTKRQTKRLSVGVRRTDIKTNKQTNRNIFVPRIRQKLE